MFVWVVRGVQEDTVHLLAGQKRLEENYKNPVIQAIYIKEYTVKYKIDNKTVYDILDQICKDTDLYPYIKQNRCGPGYSMLFLPGSYAQFTLI